MGVQALHSNGSYDTIPRSETWRSGIDISGSFSTALGAGALEADGSGSGNMACVGDAALLSMNISGRLNTGCGYGALSGNRSLARSTSPSAAASLPAMTDGTAE